MYLGNLKGIDVNLIVGYNKFQIYYFNLSKIVQISIIAAWIYNFMLK